MLVPPALPALPAISEDPSIRSGQGGGARLAAVLGWFGAIGLVWIAAAALLVATASVFPSVGLIVFPHAGC